MAGLIRETACRLSVGQVGIVHPPRPNRMKTNKNIKKTYLFIYILLFNLGGIIAPNCFRLTPFLYGVPLPG
jgi:hypothetical protein